MNFSIKGLFSKCDQIRRHADLATFTEAILNGKLHFLCSDTYIRANVNFDHSCYINQFQCFISVLPENIRKPLLF